MDLETETTKYKSALKKAKEKIKKKRIIKRMRQVYRKKEKKQLPEIKTSSQCPS